MGTELLMGNIVNTNARYLAERLSELGIDSFFQTTVGDNPLRLSSAIEIALSRANLLIFSGGLGPTTDDLTKETVAAAFNRELVLDEASLVHMEKRFAALGRVMVESNRKQAYFPVGSIIIPNPNGTAPGCIIEADNGVAAILLPGPPNEFVPMVDGFVADYLRANSDAVLLSRTLKVFGIGESSMAEMLRDIIAEQHNPTIAPYALTGEAKLRITARAKTINEGEALITPVAEKVKERLGEAVYSMNDESMQEVCARLLLEKGQTLSLAESCTGGMLASKCVDIAGSSHWFVEGCVTYSNEAKMQRLGVPGGILKAHGAVSSQTAEYMAEGMRRTSKSDVALSITGIAGPDGGTAEKPVGLVFVGLASAMGTMSIRFNLSGSRTRIREIACLHALNLLRIHLQGLSEL